MKNLAEKTALVTGGTRGIGRATALKLATHGANVAITYGKSKDEAEAVVKELLALGVKAKAYAADAAKSHSMEALANQVINDFGGVDILVHNAGMFTVGNIGEINAEEYSRVFEVNVASVFTLTNALVPKMKTGSRIIIISSILGERAANPGLGIYNASKFAATGFARSWAKDLGAKGILVNAVQPGPINTEMNPEDGEGADYLRSQTVLGRYGKPEEVAAAVHFFASPEASYITGATLNVDGGYNA